MFIETTALHKLLAMQKRIRAAQGGTSAAKTVSIEQILIDKSQSDLEPKLTSITSESFPHLKRGAIRDFKNIMMEHRYWDDDCWNATDYTYTFPLIDPISHKLVSRYGSKLEFFSVDQPSKVRGPRRHRLFINEANNIPFDTFEQLEVRTSDEIWLDWNPASPFWFDEEIVPKRSDYEHVILTYKDNEGLPRSIVESIEQRKPRSGERPSQWWTVYGLGLQGEIEGRIYTNWQLIDNLPHEARLERRGLDFGYSNDPSAVVDVYYYNGGYIWDEQLYRKGMTNKQLADLLNSLPEKNALVIADSAEPKSIDELKLYGVNVLPAQKGQGSLNQGIQYVQNQRVSVTKRSINLIKEYRNYLWQTDRDGRIINKPEGGNDHALDAGRYAMENLRSISTDDDEEITAPDWVKNAMGVR
jgi:phage terminase large subunit